MGSLWGLNWGVWPFKRGLGVPKGVLRTLLWGFGDTLGVLGVSGGLWGPPMGFWGPYGVGDPPYGVSMGVKWGCMAL